LYDFDNPGYNYKTGHFTALIWRSSSLVGFGIAEGTKISNGIIFNCVYVCASYYEPGNINVPDIFEDNVEPLLA
jgi:glioma pathogenesis-related protein 2